MAEMTSEQRVLWALQRREPDRTPHFEWLVDRHVRQALCPASTGFADFVARMGLDAVIVDPIFQSQSVAANRRRSEWGYVVQDTTEEHGIEVESPVRTLDDLDRLAPPDPCLPARFTAVEEAVRMFAGSKAVIVHLNDVFSLPRYLMGMQNLLMALHTDPQLVRALVDLSVTFNLELAREAAARGVKIVYTGDDYAYNRGPLMSPRHFREFFFPGLQRVVTGFKALGLYVIKHTDGNLWPILDMLVEAGIDCLDPIDPLAGMDLGEVKAYLGGRVALKGNVDCAHLLSFGTPDEVIAATKDALRVGMPGGGFILSSSNSIHSAVRPENYAALLKTVQEFGQYS